jgi:hypothetical protein
MFVCKKFYKIAPGPHDWKMFQQQLRLAGGRGGGGGGEGSGEGEHR